MEKDTRCPKCNSEMVLEIVYGYIPMGGEKYLKHNQIAGGCVIDENSKNFECKECKYEW